MDNLTALFKALSDKNRLKVVVALMKYEELCACQITELIQVTGATVSRHMGVLIASGLVDSRKEGRWVYYRICREVIEFTGLLQWIEKQLANDSEIASDAKVLAELMVCNPEDISRKQRTDACCTNNEKKKGKLSIITR